jgi:hypothetical protein
MRPYWKGYLKLALVCCPIALHAACSSAERIALRQINKATGNRLRQQMQERTSSIPRPGCASSAKRRGLACCRCICRAASPAHGAISSTSPPVPMRRRDRSQHRTHRNRADSGLRDRPGDDARALGCLQHMSRPPSGFCAASTTPRCRSRVESLGVFAASFEDTSMTSPTWRALGQVVLVYFAVGGAAVTAQDAQPGRATFAEVIAFARLASVPCQIR